MQKNETPRRFIRLLAVRYTVESDTVDSWQEFEEVDERGLAVPATDEVVDCDDLTLAEVARVVLDHGCSEFCGRWWGDPDGSFTVDYGTAMQEERSAHPEGFSDRERSTIDDLIQGRSTPSYPGVA